MIRLGSGSVMPAATVRASVSSLRQNWAFRSLSGEPADMARAPLNSAPGPENLAPKFERLFGVCCSKCREVGTGRGRNLPGWFASGT